MARRPIPALTADFENVVRYLQERGIMSAALSPTTLENAKKIHRATHSLILWRFRLGRLPENASVFIEEIASDALQILPQVFSGYSKTPKLLMRGIIENTLRHVYFSDHPVEFTRMNIEEKWYVSVEELMDYTKVHPDFRKTEVKFAALDRLRNLYSELSAGIHGRKVSDLEMRTALEKIVYEEDLAARLTSLVERCVEISNFFLTVFQRARFNDFSVEDRRVILRTLDARARSIWREIEQ
ncbi:hypothetical protein [Occallatibacter riparius]|uniref:Uncharacterized protein n=1 Tax=Occallatibacter riparius TaxID=1002689 RepID=A0A9J7BL58_9BACT|nr:hypothetical protein [Occallatibacter riparius]UWZ83375.1 hypothetical protein MOP44_22755 [Occallatibacter riparius]